MPGRDADGSVRWLRVASGAAHAASPDASVRAAADGWQLAIDGAPAVTLATANAHAGTDRIAPYRCAREHGNGAEHFTVLPDRAAIVGLWTAVRSSTSDGLRLAIELPGAMSVHSLDARRLVLHASAGHGLAIAGDRDVEWQIEAGTDRCTIGVRSLLPLRLAVGACAADGGPDRGVEAVLRAPALGDRIADAALARQRASAFAITCAAGDVVDACEWSHARLGALRPCGTPIDVAWGVIGLLAAGDADAARAWLAACTEGEGAAAAAAFVMAHARFVACTGRGDALAVRRAAVRRALSRIAAHGSDEDAAVRDEGLVSAALHEGAVLAEAIGDADLAALLASRARRARATFPSAAADASLLAWQAFEEERPAAAGHLLRAAAGSVLDAVARDALEPRRAAAFCGAIGAGLLGLVPDATRDRMTLRPRIPGALLPFSATGLRAGEAAFDLSVAVRGEIWEVVVEQTAGAVPLQLILEPWLPFPAFRGILVDGRDADLAARPVDGGWVLPVQLVPDHVRRLEVLLDMEAGPP